MILQEGDFVLVVHRRLFDADAPRFFVGVVDGYDAGVAKVTGNTWVRDPFAGVLIKKEDERTKIFSVSSGTLIVYQLPEETDMSSVKFDSRDGRLLLTDTKKMNLDLSEVEHGKTRKN